MSVELNYFLSENNWLRTIILGDKKKEMLDSEYPVLPETRYLWERTKRTLEGVGREMLRDVSLDDILQPVKVTYISYLREEGLYPRVTVVDCLGRRSNSKDAILRFLQIVFGVYAIYGPAKIDVVYVSEEPYRQPDFDVLKLSATNVADCFQQFGMMNCIDAAHMISCMSLSVEGIVSGITTAIDTIIKAGDFIEAVGGIYGAIELIKKVLSKRKKGKALSIISNAGMEDSLTVAEDSHPVAFESSERLKGGYMVNVVLRQLLEDGVLSQDDIETLRDGEMCRQLFGSGTPMLIDIDAPIGGGRHYSKPVVIGGKPYWLNNNSSQKNLRRLADWMRMFANFRSI